MKKKVKHVAKKKVVKKKAPAAEGTAPEATKG